MQRTDARHAGRLPQRRALLTIAATAVLLSEWWSPLLVPLLRWVIEAFGVLP